MTWKETKSPRQTPLHIVRVEKIINNDAILGTFKKFFFLFPRSRFLNPKVSTSSCLPRVAQTCPVPENQAEVCRAKIWLRPFFVLFAYSFPQESHTGKTHSDAKGRHRMVVATRGRAWEGAHFGEVSLRVWFNAQEWRGRFCTPPRKIKDQARQQSAHNNKHNYYFSIRMRLSFIIYSLVYLFFAKSKRIP